MFKKNMFDTFERDFKALVKLGNIVAETLLRMQMFPSLNARETYVAEIKFAARKQQMFLPKVKNILVSWTQAFCFQLI